MLGFHLLADSHAAAAKMMKIGSKKRRTRLEMEGSQIAEQEASEARENQQREMENTIRRLTEEIKKRDSDKLAMVQQLSSNEQELLWFRQ